MTFLLDHDVPDDLVFALQALGHTPLPLRSVLPIDTDDATALGYAAQHRHVVITCNRDAFLALARTVSHAGLIILIRRRSRAAERAALIRLLDRAGTDGILANINFA